MPMLQQLRGVNGWKSVTIRFLSELDKILTDEARRQRKSKTLLINEILAKEFNFDLEAQG